MAFTRREIREYVESQEEPDQTYVCRVCGEVKPAADFPIKVSYRKEQNKVYCARYKSCRKCANARDAETARKRRNKPTGVYEEELKKVPLKVAEQLLADRPEAIALLARTFPTEFRKRREVCIDTIHKRREEMRSKASKAKEGGKAHSRVFNENDQIVEQALDGASLIFSRKKHSPPLTKAQVAEIRYQYQYEGKRVMELARRFKRNESTIRNVISGRAYKDVK